MKVDPLSIGRMLSANQSVPEKNEIASEEFEAYLLEMMIKEMRKTIPDGIFSSNEMDLFQEMMDRAIAQDMASRGGLGLSEALLRSMPNSSGEQVGQTIASESTEMSSGVWAIPEERRLSVELGAKLANSPMVKKFKVRGVTKEIPPAVLEQAPVHSHHVHDSTDLVHESGHVHEAFVDRSPLDVKSAFLQSTNGQVQVPVSGIKSSSFGMRHHPILKTHRQHNGLDLAAPTGTPIYPLSDGVVITSEYRRGLGNVVVVDHGDGWTSTYAHCDELFSIVGQSVKMGEQIATVGETGMATGPHLHLEIRQDGVAVDPELLLAP